MLPELYTYDDYRRFLHDWMEAKAKLGSFSARWFARRAGFRAQNMMHLVMQGKRNLTRESLRKFTVALGLNDRETEYFESLVGMNQAKSHEERLHYYERIIRHPGRRRVRPMEEAQLAFFSHWMGPLIYEMIQMDEFTPDPQWIASLIEPEPLLGDVRQVLKDLLRSGLVVEGADGRWRQAEPQLHSGDDVNSVHLYSYHEQALAKAADALHDVPAPRRHFHVLTTAVPNEVIPELVELTQKYEAELWRLVEAAKAPRDQVVQVGLHIFPTLRVREAPRLRVPHEKKRGKR